MWYLCCDSGSEILVKGTFWDAELHVKSWRLAAPGVIVLEGKLRQPTVLESHVPVYMYWNVNLCKSMGEYYNV